MLKFLKLIYGYVIILVRGENLERFLNLCKSRKVIWKRSGTERTASLWHKCRPLISFA